MIDEVTKNNPARAAGSHICKFCPQPEEEEQTEEEAEIEATQNKLETALKSVQEFPSDLEAALKKFTEESNEAAQKLRELIIAASLSDLRQLLERLADLSVASGTSEVITKLAQAVSSAGVTVGSLIDFLG